jgi:hypothetical protein
VGNTIQRDVGVFAGKGYVEIKSCAQCLIGGNQMTEVPDGNWFITTHQQGRAPWQTAAGTRFSDNLAAGAYGSPSAYVLNGQDSEGSSVFSADATYEHNVSPWVVTPSTPTYMMQSFGSSARYIHNTQLPMDSALDYRFVIGTDICKMTPAFVEYFDAELYDTAKAAGREYSFYKSAAEAIKPASVVIVGFDDFSDRHRAKHLKRLKKQFGTIDGIVLSIAQNNDADEMLAALDVPLYTARPDHGAEATPLLYSGFHVPTERLEDFVRGVEALSAKEHIALPMAGHAYTNTYSLYPQFSLGKVADKQKIFKLLDELTKLVYDHGGTMIAEGGEGRLKAKFVYAQLDERVVQMYEEIRKVCDPHTILNPGVKQIAEVRAMAEMLRDHHDVGQNARYGV